MNDRADTMPAPREPDDRTAPPDTPEWGRILIADVRELSREVTGLATVVKRFAGAAVTLLQRYDELDRRVSEIEEWRRETMAQTGRFQTLPGE